MERTSHESIAEALKLLEEAAIQKKDEVKSLLSDKFTHLRNVMRENEGGLLDVINHAKVQAVEAVTQARDVGVAKARDIACDVDQRVHKNPWPYLAGTTVVGLLLGYILGRNRK
jgi:ElaB/YqjD/DUF883 family membrane-anchored ribosome-binding protein